MDTLKMKKQFQRMKQIADQTFMRAEKSEVLTEDVQLAEKRLETLQKACSTTAKKISGSICVPGNDGNSLEKRLKKIPAVIIGNAMLECCASMGEDSIMSMLLNDCGQLESKLGNELLQHELELEQQVLQPLTQVETEAANIVKLKRNLTKLIADMDSAKTRYQTAMKHSTSGSAVGTKVDVVKEELEDCQHKVDLAKDSYAAEVYAFLAKEAELAQLILQLARCQSRYHRSALDLLEKQIPLLESVWSESSQKPVFGCSLEEHLRLTERSVAYPIEVCVCALYDTALQEEGLFRVAGGASKVRKLKAAFDAGVADLGFILSHFRDVHVVAGTLKSYLRELPEPLLTHALHDEWCAAVKIADQDAKLQALWTAVQKLPETRRNNLRYLVKFLKELSSHSDGNKMSVQNLSIVMAPGLIWSQGEDGETLGRNMSLTSTYSAIAENLITFADWFFPGEIDFFITCSKYSLFSSGSTQSNSNEDKDDGGFKEYTHRRMGSNEGINPGLRPVGSSGNILENMTVDKESPRPVTRKKNKPAPVPPGMVPGSSQTPIKSPSSAKTPDKDEQTVSKFEQALEISDRPKPADKTSLPPNGPDPRRALTADKRPAVAPRPSVNPERPPHAFAAQSGPIGFESLEKEILERNKQPNSQQRPSSETHETTVETRGKPPHPAYRRLTSLDGVALHQSSNPTVHPNAVPLFGFVQPSPLERTKLPSSAETEKQRPQIPERPSLAAKNSVVDHSQTGANESEPPKGSETRNHQTDTQSQLHLERVHSFSVDKQHVSIVQLNPLTLNSVDHPDIEYADVDELTPTTENATKPARPPKPERLSQNQAETNNNTKAEQEEVHSALPRPLPRPQPPPPPAKPRTGSNTSVGSTSDSTDF